jgi:cytoskeletal protein RodZ
LKKTVHDDQLMLSIGALLAAEREKRGIPVEKAAKETRMRPQRLRDMENDDLSHFTNPSYARMFIIAYAKYLGIPMKTISEHLPDPGVSVSEGYQYISTSTEELPSLRHDIATKPARRNNVLVALVLTTLAVVGAGAAGVIYFVAIKADQITARVNQPAPTPEPEPPAPQIIVRETLVFNNVQQDGSKATAFDDSVRLETPPTPEPNIVNVRQPAPELNVSSAPAATATPAQNTVVPDDHAFLLGASPDAKPVNVP